MKLSTGEINLCKRNTTVAAVFIDRGYRLSLLRETVLDFRYCYTGVFVLSNIIQFQC